MTAIIQKTSPNFQAGRKTARGTEYKPEAIVIHIMEGTLTGTDSWFANPDSKVSAHYGIGKNGEIHQYVQEKDTAWHAGRVDKPGWTLIKPAGKPGAYINPNLYTIGIEHEGKENDDWTPQMYQASADLIKEIATRWHIPIDRDHIIGHHDIYSVKSCPGHKVDLQKLIQLANGATTNTDAPVSQVKKIEEQGKATTRTALFIRKQPNRNLPPVSKANEGVQLAYDGYTNDGEDVNGNKKWYYTHEGNWFWSGGIK